jgi:hypothetical protein
MNETSPSQPSERAVDSGSPAPDVDDPVAEAFPIMLEAAERLCPRTGPDGDRCYRYHRSWAYLRAIGYRAVTGRSKHFVDEFRSIARTGAARRVLIAGTADYAMLARVLHAFRAEGVEPEVTVLDICGTPLDVNRWYARRRGAQIETRACSVLELEGDARFDLVTTDNFISRIPRQQQGAVVEAWTSALRQNGKLVTAEVVSSAPLEDGVRRLSAEGIDQIADYVRELAKESSAVVGVSPEVVVQSARDYYGSQESFPVASLESLRAMVEAAGLRIDTLTRLPRQLRRRPRPLRSERFLIVASNAAT